MNTQTCLLLAIGCSSALAQLLEPSALAASYALTTSTALPFPTATQANADTQLHIVNNWSLNSNRITDGAANLAFVEDPFPSSTTPLSTNTTGPVLAVTYPGGNFGSTGGGAQFYSVWEPSDGNAFESMQISYDVAFDSAFDWVKGGKLPGLRGGASGCSGGSEPDGTNCFSTRLMWRDGGEGEVYAYIPRPNNLCDSRDIVCNDDYGISINRGIFGFASGTWNRITILIQMNSPSDIANGNMVVYFNNVQAFTRHDLQFRSASSLSIGGMYFSTFFGGSDASWSTTKEEHTYFRNIELWGSYTPSTLSGDKVVGAAMRRRTCSFLLVSLALSLRLLALLA